MVSPKGRNAMRRRIILKAAASFDRAFQVSEAAGTFFGLALALMRSRPRS
jgi:hypothetical protein